MKRTIATGMSLALALAACQQGPNENIAIDESNSLNAEIETLPPDESSLRRVRHLNGDTCDTTRKPYPVTAITTTGSINNLMRNSRS